MDWFIGVGALTFIISLSELLHMIFQQQYTLMSCQLCTTCLYYVYLWKVSYELIFWCSKLIGTTLFSRGLKVLAPLPEVSLSFHISAALFLRAKLNEKSMPEFAPGIHHTILKSELPSGSSFKLCCLTWNVFWPEMTPRGGYKQIMSPSPVLCRGNPSLPCHSVPNQNWGPTVQFKGVHRWECIL